MMVPQHPAIVLHRLRYSALPTPFASHDGDPAQSTRELATCVGDTASAFIEEAAVEPDDYFIGSTLGSHHLSDPDSTCAEYKALIVARAGRALDAAVNVYECTNWAFLLREALARSRAINAPRRLLMQVVDCDVHGIEATWRTRTYGNARFGILSLDIEVDATGSDDDIVIDVAPLSVSMLKFGTCLRTSAAARADAVVSAPFFPETTSQAFRRILRGADVLEERHVEFGHCFGADPWIGLGLAHQGGERRYVMGSLALNGYYAISTITVAESAKLSVTRP